MAEGYCVFLNLEARRCVVVGGGAVAHRKVEALLRCGAAVHVVAPQICQSLAKRSDLQIHSQPYSQEILEDAVLVFACTDDKQLNHQISRDCRGRSIVCNVVDDPDWCDFIVPAVLKRGPIQIAVGTCGSSPYLAGRIRDLIGGWLDRSYGSFAQALASVRGQVIQQVASPEQRKAILQTLAGKESFERFKSKGQLGWLEWADHIGQGQLKLTQTAGIKSDQQQDTNSQQPAAGSQGT